MDFAMDNAPHLLIRTPRASRLVAVMHGLALLTLVAGAGCGGDQPATPPAESAGPELKPPGNAELDEPRVSLAPETSDTDPAAKQAEGPGLAIGEPAPPFELADQHGAQQRLEDLLQKGNVALVFYRSADW